MFKFIRFNNLAFSISGILIVSWSAGILHYKDAITNALQKHHNKENNKTTENISLELQQHTNTSHNLKEQILQSQEKLDLTKKQKSSTESIIQNLQKEIDDITIVIKNWEDLIQISNNKIKQLNYLQPTWTTNINESQKEHDKQLFEIKKLEKEIEDSNNKVIKKQSEFNTYLIEKNASERELITHNNEINNQLSIIQQTSQEITELTEQQKQETEKLNEQQKKANDNKKEINKQTEIIVTTIKEHIQNLRDSISKPNSEINSDIPEPHKTKDSFEDNEKITTPNKQIECKKTQKNEETLYEQLKVLYSCAASSVVDNKTKQKIQQAFDNLSKLNENENEFNLDLQELTQIKSITDKKLQQEKDKQKNAESQKLFLDSQTTKITNKKNTDEQNYNNKQHELDFARQEQISAINKFISNQQSLNLKKINLNQTKEKEQQLLTDINIETINQRDLENKKTNNETTLQIKINQKSEKTKELKIHILNIEKQEKELEKLKTEQTKQ